MMNNAIDASRSEEYIGLCRLLVRLSKDSRVLPRCVFTQGVVCTDSHPVSGGSFADIFMGLLGGRLVALKRLRIFGVEQEKEEQRRLVRVCESGSFLLAKPTDDSTDLIQYRSFCQEALVWRLLKHENIMSFLGVDQANFSPHLCMVSPWMANGNMMECRKKMIEQGKEVPADSWVSLVAVFIIENSQHSVVVSFS